MWKICWKCAFFFCIRFHLHMSIFFMIFFPLLFATKYIDFVLRSFVCVCVCTHFHCGTCLEFISKCLQKPPRTIKSWILVWRAESRDKIDRAQKNGNEKKMRWRRWSAQKACRENGAHKISIASSIFCIKYSIHHYDVTFHFTIRLHCGAAMTAVAYAHESQLCLVV